ncbi:MAG: hypothetical protein H7201_16865 [Candidatus Saccharibacteria bacterium]|nr:hypothetical protein [Microbacteriaceae bacterium]
MKDYPKSRLIRGVVVNAIMLIGGLILALWEPHNPLFTGGGIGLVIGATRNGTAIYYKVQMSRWAAAYRPLSETAEQFAKVVLLDGKR